MPSAITACSPPWPPSSSPSPGDDKPHEHQNEGEPVELAVGDGEQPGDDGGLRRDHQDDAAGGVKKLRYRVEPPNLFGPRPIEADESSEPPLRLRCGLRCG